jgi:hypothetical protein
MCQFENGNGGEISKSSDQYDQGLRITDSKVKSSFSVFRGIRGYKQKQCTELMGGLYMERSTASVAWLKRDHLMLWILYITQHRSEPSSLESVIVRCLGVLLKIVKLPARAVSERRCEFSWKKQEIFYQF